MSDRNQMLDPKLPTVGWVMAASIWQKHSNPIPSSFSSFYIYIYIYIFTTSSISNPMNHSMLLNMCSMIVAVSQDLRGSGISGISGISQGLSASLRKCASYMRKVIQQLGQNWAELWLTHYITFLFEETPRENWKLRKRAFLSIKSPGVRFQFSLEAIGSMSSEIETPGKRRLKMMAIF